MKKMLSHQIQVTTGIWESALAAAAAATTNRVTAIRINHIRKEGYMNEQELRERIKVKRREAENAGLYHRRDLMREIRRLEKELRTYRYYQNKARQGLSA